MNNQIDRRNFISSSAAAGAGLMIANSALGQNGGKKDINIALLGAGAQGQVLMNAILKLGRNSGVKFRAVCDIWEKGNLRRVSRTLKAYARLGHKGTAYVDYQEMLEKEKTRTILFAKMQIHLGQQNFHHFCLFILHISYNNSNNIFI